MSLDEAGPTRLSNKKRAEKLCIVDYTIFFIQVQVFNYVLFKLYHI